MKIYTKKGDNGFSSLINKKQISKADLVFDVIGTLDELNANLGLLHTSRNTKLKKVVFELQNDLFTLGSLLAGSTINISWNERVEWLESQIDLFDSNLPNLQNFILPGGSKNAVYLHNCRAICRRLERTYVLYFQKIKEKPDQNIQKYLNRLSDLLFVLARYVNFKLGIKDLIWKLNEK